MKVFDDHWGAFTNRCELRTGHEGDHRYVMTACEPIAYMGWPLDIDGDGCAS